MKQKQSAKGVALLLAALFLLTACNSDGQGQGTDGTTSNTEDMTEIGSLDTETQEPQRENPINFDALSYNVHDDSKVFLNYADDERNIYPTDPYSAPSGEKRHYFNTRSGVGIQNTDVLKANFRYSEVQITNDDGVYKTQWRFNAQKLGAVPELYIDTQNRQIFNKVTVVVTNRSEKPLTFSLRTSEFNAQPEDNPKTGTFSAFSKPVASGSTKTITFDFTQSFSSYELLPLCTGALFFSAVGAVQDIDYEVLLSDFTFYWAENEDITDAAVGVREETASVEQPISLAIYASGLSEEQDVAVEFHRDGELFTWRVRLTEEEKAALRKDGSLGLSTVVPWWAATGDYQVVLAVDSYRVADAFDDVLHIVNEGEYSFPAVEVKQNQGVPALYVNGELFDWNGIASASYCPGMAYEFGEAGSSVYFVETNAGNHNYAVNSYPTLVAPGVNDYSELTEVCQYTMQANEDAYLILRINFCLPDFWYREHMDSAALGTSNGKDFFYSEESIGVNNISFASRAWMEESKVQLKAMLDYIRTQPWSSRVLGCMLSGGVTEEWFAFFHNTAGAWGDYSEVNQEGFRNWADGKKLLDGVDDIHVPLPSERLNDGYILKPDTAEAALSAAYTQYISELCASVINELSGTIKDETDGRLLCGALYGYLIEFAGATSPTQSGSLHVGYYLSQENIDYLAGIPMLDWRDPTNGYDIGISVTRSIQEAGKLYVSENDEWLSTYVKKVYPSSRPGDKTDGNQDMLESTFAYNMVYGNLQHYFSLFASWHHEEWVKDLFTRFNAIQEEYLEADRTPTEEIALLIDDTSYMFSEETSTYFDAAIKQTVRALGRTGGAVGHYLLSDIDSLPDSVKLVVVSVGWSPTAETLQKVKKAIEDGGRTYVFVGPIGLIDPVAGEYDLSSTAAITGFDISVTFRNSLITKQITSLDGKAINNSASVPVNPLCEINGTGELTAIRELANGGKLIWLSVPLTNTNVWRAIGEEAGVVFTAGVNSYVHASETLVSVTSGVTGTQELNFGRAVKVVDLLTGWEGSGDTVSCSFYAGQTRLFYLTDLD